MDILRQTSPTRENLSLLSVLEALEDREHITQRELAHETGLNLKKVNYCLHKLLEKGYIKFERARKNPDKRAYLYILTPAGLRAKSALTYRFLKFTMDFYGRMEEKLRHCLDEMDARGVRRVVLYGASDVARIVIGMVDGTGPEIVAVMDESEDGREFHGIPAIKQGQLGDVDWDGVLITTVDGYDAAEAALKGLGVAEEAIWRL